LEGFRKILQLVKPYWQRVAVAAVISLIISGLSAALAWLAKPALDDVFIKKDSTLLVLLPLAVLAIFVIKGAFSFCYEYLMRSASQKMVMDIRSRLYAHIIELPLEHFGKNSSGELMSRILNDTSLLQGVVSMTVKDLFVESATIIGLLAVAFWRRWDLTLIAVIVLPAALYWVGKLGKRMKQISRRTQEKMSALTEFLGESFTGIKIIKAFSMQSREVGRLTARNRELYRESMRATRVSEFSSLIMEAVGGLGIASVMWYGGSLVIRGTITVGDFFSFLTAIFMVLTPAKRLVGMNMDFQRAKAAFDRIFHLLAEKKEEGGTTEIEPIRAFIELRDVSFSYPLSRGRALDGINLRVRKGEVIAIVGKSGGGKTTLANLLPRFYMPSGGAIYIDDMDISAATLQSLRSQFGIVSQEVILFNDTVKVNIAYGKPQAPMDEIISAAEAAYAHDFIMELPDGYDTMIGERGMRLSGGQRQRLSIARAILKNPPILILDEATSSLDTASEMMVQKALENLMKDRTTFVIAHRLSTINRADRIVVLDKGRVIASGTHRELFAQEGLYRELYELQFSRE
jgi:subfamily B ATP-binding cassette protein MsbA